MIKGLNGMHRILKLLSATSNFLFKGRRDSEEVGSKDVRYIKILINKKKYHHCFLPNVANKYTDCVKIVWDNGEQFVFYYCFLLLLLLFFFAIKIHKDHKKHCSIF